MAELQETEKETLDNAQHSQATSLGNILQAARDAKALSLQDVSDILRYSVKQIDALEKDEYHLLPDAMITRGFIRNYARILELDAEPLLASYRLSVSSETDKMIAVHSSMRPVQLTKDSTPWLKYILASILVLLFLLAWLFYVDYMPKPSAVVSEKIPEVIESPAPAVAEPLPEIALPAAQRVAEADSIAPDVLAGQNMALNAAAQPAANAIEVKPENTVAQADLKTLTPSSVSSSVPSVTQSVQVPASVNPVKSSDKILNLVFTAQTWVSMTDKSGKVIYEKMSHNGDKETINIVPPINLVIGNASGTKLNYGGKDIDFAPNTKNNVVRLTLE